MPHPGHFQQWVHDRNGRPLWMHFTQGFELFADQLPVIAESLQALTGERPVLVFDRGGYRAPAFTALNAKGAGWVTWLKGAKPLVPSAFTETGVLPQRRPGAPERTVHYVTTTHAVTGCHAHIAAIHRHEGDPRHQVALLTNLDCSQPERFRPLELIAMLDGRWAQENSFKAQEQHVDLGWTNGYVHEPSAATPVPNPRVRQLRRRIAEHTGQPVERIEADSDRDRWFTAEEAREYGFIDQVIASARQAASLNAGQ